MLFPFNVVQLGSELEILFFPVFNISCKVGAYMAILLRRIEELSLFNLLPKQGAPLFYREMLLYLPSIAFPTKGVQKNV